MYNKDEHIFLYLNAQIQQTNSTKYKKEWIQRVEYKSLGVSYVR